MVFGETAVLEIVIRYEASILSFDLVSWPMKSALAWMHPSLGAARKPFYLPDFIHSSRFTYHPEHLIDALEEAKAPGSKEEMNQSCQGPESNRHPWLTDVSKAAQHHAPDLESSAQAA